MLNPFAIVTLTEDLPAQELKRGHVGTVLEEVGANVYEVEFSDADGKTYATLALRDDQLIRVYYESEL